MPSSADLSGTRGLPTLDPNGFGGSSGSTISHSPSLTNSFVLTFGLLHGRNQPPSILPLASATARPGLQEAHKMALRVGEHRDARAVWHVHRPCHPAPTEALDLAQRRLEVPDLHVEGDVAFASLGGRADTAVNAARYARVGHRVARARRQHLPVKRVPVEVLESLAVLADDLDVHYWVTHQLLLSVPPLYRCG